MSIQIKQYPRTLETKAEIAITITWFEEQASWCPTSHPGIYISCLGRSLGPLSLMSLIPPGVHCLGSENYVLQLPIGRGKLTHLCFEMDRLCRRLQCTTYLDKVAPGLKDTKCKLPAFLHTFPGKTVPERHRP